MSVYQPSDGITYRYDFWFRGQRHRGTTHQTTLDDARAFETELRARLRRQLGGLLRPQDTPRFVEWAGVYYEHAAAHLERPDHVDVTLRVVLRFWGARPGPNSAAKVEATAPYHDLRLADPIQEPDWIEQFEAWIAARGVSPQTRNHYFSIMSRMYRVALLPKFRKHSGVLVNPFVGIPKQKTQSRDVVLSVSQIRAWLQAASYHVRLTAAIAALAPKLRVSNILQLQWRRDLDEPRTFITVAAHKTAHRTGRPLVAPITAQLRAILKDARARHPDSTHVVVYSGRPVRSIHGAVKAAFEAAGIPYGRALAGGATFHTVRHSMATLLATLDETEAQRAALMGQDPATTHKYTHLRPMQERRIAERLSRAVKIRDVVTLPHLRAVRAKLEGESGGPRQARPTKVANSRGNRR